MLIDCQSMTAIAPPRPQDRIGFTAPTIIYDKMRAIEALRGELGQKITTFAGDPAFVGAWRAWEQRWIPFFQKYQTPGLGGDVGRLGAVFFTDDLDGQVEEFRGQINAFYADYQRQRQANGQPVPRPATPPLPRPLGPAGAGGGGGLPWWFWMASGVALVGGGYLAYRYYVNAQKLKAGIREEILPLVLPGGLGGAVARATRDEASSLEPRTSSSRSSNRFPRTLEDFARDPRAERSYSYDGRRDEQPQQRMLPRAPRSDVRRLGGAYAERGYGYDVEYPNEYDGGYDDE